VSWPRERKVAVDKRLRPELKQFAIRGMELDFIEVILMGKPEVPGVLPGVGIVLRRQRRRPAPRSES
jgi:hypothetical protein